ncbi:hypothetical protein Q5P01_002528 [Channa striata]|uniref:Macro domain-containing protein n=1 Tax=Channa striata TaxID=64152 RepID=A0AA88NR78_CHASR|nr:hypothetical protein Q5P01_002528 [Channa striata]
MKLQDPSFTTDYIKVYTESGYSVVVGEAEVVKQKITILEKSVPVRKELPIVEKQLKLVEEEFIRMRAHCPEVKMLISNTMIILEGLDKDVQSGATKLDELIKKSNHRPGKDMQSGTTQHELMKKVKEKRVKLPPDLLNFIKSSAVIHKYRLQQSLRNPVSLVVGSDLVLSSLSSDALDEALAIVLRDMSVEIVILQNATAEPPGLDEVKEILIKAKNEENRQEFRVDVSFIPGVSKPAITKVRIVGYSENVNKLKEVLKDYQMNHFETAVMIDISSELVDCFHKLFDLTAMKKTKVTMKTSNVPHPSVFISGPYCLVQEVRADLNAKLAGVTSDTLVLDGVNVLVVPMLNKGLASTKIGKCLMKKGGSTIRRNFALMAATCTLAPGDILQLDGSPSLGCSKIYFIECLPWDGVKGQSVQALGNGLKRCLDLCVQQCWCSVAFPVIGPGIVLKYPLREAIRILTDTIHQFGLSASSGSLSKIHIVIRPDYPDSEECYSDVHRRISLITSKGGQVIVTSLTSDLDEFTMTVGGIVKLQLVFGDITNETTDAVVNTTLFSDCQTDSLCKDILTKAGPHVEAILKSAKVNRGDVFQTQPGSFPCKAILHVCGDKDVGLIEHLVCRIIQHCESSGYKSVAIPAICAGAGGLDPDVVALAILRGIKTATSSTPLHFLTNIRLVLIKINVFMAFKHQTTLMFSHAVVKSVSVAELLCKAQKNATKSINADINTLCTRGHQSVFLFVGLCEKKVKDAKTKLKDLYLAQCLTKTFMKDQLEGLTQDDLKSLKQLVEAEGLYVQRDEFGPGRLTVSGPNHGVSQVVQMICTITPLKRNLRLKEEEDLYNRVTWCILGHCNNWERLPKTANYSLENNDRAGGILDAQGISWSVDLQRMEAKREGTGEMAKLKRLQNPPGERISCHTRWSFLYT